MLKTLSKILEIQEFDMQMIQLMRLKHERIKELNNIESIKANLKRQAMLKENEIIELKKTMLIVEGELADVVARLKKLESQQNSVKKVEEFNALTHEMAQVDRERVAKEQRASDLQDKINLEEDALKNLNASLDTTIAESRSVEKEIEQTIQQINDEGRALKEQRDQLVAKADPEVFSIYERLLRNKKDRVVVPIENRCCSGCHIMLTAQDENLVRKGERIVFCEHCSRIHYWPESEALEEAGVAAKTRRRRK